MPRNFDAAMADSTDCFRRLIEKPLLKILGGGRIIMVEGVEGEIAKTLDLQAGIDALHDHPRFGVNGLAIRTQIGANYETFTIRYRRESGGRTEFEKRLHALRHDKLTPKLTVQCYVDPTGEKLLAGAVARTEDLYACIDRGKYRMLATGSDQIGRASFYAIDWDDVRSLPSSWCPIFNA